MDVCFWEDCHNFIGGIAAWNLAETLSEFHINFCEQWFLDIHEVDIPARIPSRIVVENPIRCSESYATFSQVFQKFFQWFLQEYIQDSLQRVSYRAVHKFLRRFRKRYSSWKSYKQSKTDFPITSTWFAPAIPQQFPPVILLSVPLVIAL